MLALAVVSSVSLAVVCLTVLLTVRMALADSAPQERPEILKALAKVVQAIVGMFRRR